MGLDPVKFIEIQTWRKLSPPMRFLIRTNFFFQKFQTRKVLNCWRYFSLNVFIIRQTNGKIESLVAVSSHAFNAVMNIAQFFLCS